MLNQPLTADDRTIPKYSGWTRKELETECAALEQELERALSILTVSSRKATRPASVNWLASQFDRWCDEGLGLFTVATVEKFEQHVAPLVTHRHLEVPPYAEVLLQPGVGVACRHPEYMLVRDLGMLYDLYRDAETLCERIDPLKPPSWAFAAGENVQGLARSVVQACFNLLESYVSGLARAHVMKYAVEPSVRAKLLDNREALKKRIRQVPALIVGREFPLSPDDYPIGPLFNQVKRNRDAFVHCEPGPQDSGRGYVKEAAFHDTSKELVTLAVTATHDLIRQIWRFIYDEDGPRWLPPLEPSGRFGKQNLALVPATKSGR